MESKWSKKGVRMKTNYMGALIMVSLAGLLLSGCGHSEKPNELQIAEKRIGKGIN